MTVPERVILKIMLDVVDKFLIPKFDSYGMEATGEWRRNIRVRADKKSGYIDGRDYTINLVEGYKGYVEATALYKWGRAKYGSSFSMNSAYAVQQKILKVGTTWYQRGGTDLINVLESDEVVNYVNTEIGKYLTVQVELEINKMANQILAQ